MAVLGVLAFGGAGAFIGGAVFGKAALGWTVGSTIGRMLFAPKQPHQVGPRLGDLQVTSSTHGQPINIGFGTHRVNGNIIWARPMREVAVRSGGGGKGGKGGGGKGGGGGTTTFQYYATWAVAFAEGEAEDVLRIWANNELIYDKTVEGAPMRKSGLSFRFYRGTDTQMPDGLIQADKGADLTPAYRGICYIVFEEYNVTDIRHVPSITAEITFKKSDERVVVPAQTLQPDMGFQATASAFDVKRGRAIVQRLSGSAITFRRFNLHTMREDMRKQVDFGLTGSSPAMAVGYKGTVFFTAGPPSNSRPIAAINPDTLDGHTVFGFSSSNLGITDSRIEWTTNIGTSGLRRLKLGGGWDDIQYLACGTEFGRIGILKGAAVPIPGGLTYVDDEVNTLKNANNGGDIDFTYSRVKSVIGDADLTITTEFFFLCGSRYVDIGGNTSPIRFYRWRAWSDLTVRELLGKKYHEIIDPQRKGLGFSHIRDYTPGELIPGETQLLNAGTGAVLDKRNRPDENVAPTTPWTDGGIIFPAQAASDNAVWFIKIDIWTGDIIWRVKTPMTTIPPTEGTVISGSELHEDSFGMIRPVSNAGSRGLLINTITGELEVADPASPAAYEDVYPASGNRGVYDSASNSFIGLARIQGQTDPVVARWYFGKGQGLSESVGTIVSSLCRRAGLADSDFDVSDISMLEEHGYVIGGFATARQGIIPLAVSNMFEGVESDWKIKFNRRGKAPVRSLDVRDLSVIDQERGYALEKTRDNDKVLPRQMKVEYIDYEIDYETGAQPFQRTLAPTPVMQSENETFVQLPVAMNSEKAARIAEILTYTEWMERTTFRFISSWENIDLEPGDVVTVNVGPVEHRMRIVGADIGAHMSVEFNAVEEYAGQYESAAVGADYRGFDQQTVLVGGLSRLRHIDGPLMLDSHEPANRATAPLYWQGGHFGQTGWSGAVAYKSPDELQWNITGVITTPMAWGMIINALGNPKNGNAFKTDDVNHLHVGMIHGDDTLESVTYEEMLNGANFGAIIKENGEVEYVQWMDAEEQDDGTFILTNLLRGRRGTDTMAFGHGPGEILIIPDILTGGLDQIPIDAIGNEKFWKLVTNGQLFDQALSEGFESQGRSLMPYAPYRHKATLEAGNDIDISWQRRTRIGGEWMNDADDIPLFEDDEEYEIEILDAPEGDVVRTVTELATAAYTYTAADQATDGFTAPLETLTVRIYQISAQVGRGFTREVTINVEA